MREQKESDQMEVAGCVAASMKLVKLKELRERWEESIRIIEEVSKRIDKLGREKDRMDP